MVVGDILQAVTPDGISELVVRFVKHHPKAQIKLSFRGDALDEIDGIERGTGVFERGDAIGNALMGGEFDFAAIVSFDFGRRTLGEIRFLSGT